MSPAIGSFHAAQGRKPQETPVRAETSCTGLRASRPETFVNGGWRGVLSSTCTRRGTRPGHHSGLRPLSDQ